MDSTIFDLFVISILALLISPAILIWLIAKHYRDSNKREDV